MVSWEKLNMQDHVGSSQYSMEWTRLLSPQFIKLLIEIFIHHIHSGGTGQSLNRLFLPRYRLQFQDTYKQHGLDTYHPPGLVSSIPWRSSSCFCCWDHEDKEVYHHTAKSGKCVDPAHLIPLPFPSPLSVCQLNYLLVLQHQTSSYFPPQKQWYGPRSLAGWLYLWPPRRHKSGGKFSLATLVTDTFLPRKHAPETNWLKDRHVSK